jgi:hypothetical protein
MVNQEIYENVHEALYYWLKFVFSRLLFGSPKVAIFYRYTIPIGFIRTGNMNLRLKRTDGPS